MICEAALLLFSDVRSGLIRLDNDDFTHAEPCLDVSSGVDGEELWQEGLRDHRNMEPEPGSLPGAEWRHP